MNDAELDRTLKQGREQARRFFDGRNEVCREAISPHVRRSSRAWWKTCLAGAGMMAVAAVCAVAVMALCGPLKETSQHTNAGFNEQTVYLNEDKAYRMNTVPVNMSDKDTGLITVLWEMGDDEQMAYYSLFEACDIAYPALTIPFPEANYDMLLIASGDSKAGELGYRLIGYGGDALTTLWSQDRLPGGLVTLDNGVAVERRTTGDDATVTYIVPIQMTTLGCVALPVDTLHMCVGERILLVGAEGVNTTTRNGLLNTEEQQDSGVPAVLLKALRAGTDVVSVGSAERAQTLYVDIAE